MKKQSKAPAPKKSGEFTKEEKEAMRARAKELKAEANKAAGEGDLLAVLKGLPSKSRGMGERLHEIIKSAAPQLSPKTWYGMPAYANADGKVVIFFRPAEKFKERYITLGFNQEANLDEGSMWPIAYAITKLTPADEKMITALVKTATR